MREDAQHCDGVEVEVDEFGAVEIEDFFEEIRDEETKAAVKEYLKHHDLSGV